MTRKPTALASLDIETEGLAQQDGLAERLMRQRASKATPPTLAQEPKVVSSPSAEGRTRPVQPLALKTDKNAWRRGKGLLQVPIPDEAHIELSILAKRRRLQLTQLARSALNLWLETHGYPLRIPE